MSYIIGFLIGAAVAYVVIRHRRNTDHDETEQGVGGGGGGRRGAGDYLRARITARTLPTFSGTGTNGVVITQSLGIISTE